jgi:hypothetical protein
MDLRLADRLYSIAIDAERLQHQRAETIRRLRTDESNAARGTWLSAPRDPEKVDDQLRVLRASADVKLADLDRRLYTLKAEELEVRERLAKAVAHAQDRVGDLESSAYSNRRLRFHDTIQLTESDLRSAQNSVPGWVVVLLAASAVVIFAISQAEMPSVLAAVIALSTFVGTLVLGGLQVHYARLAVKEDHSRGIDGIGSPPSVVPDPEQVDRPAERRPHPSLSRRSRQLRSTSRRRPQTTPGK